MSKLIEALNIFLKYGNPDFATNCEYEELLVMIDPAVVSSEDTAALEELEFTPDQEGYFKSHFFGSA